MAFSPEMSARNDWYIFSLTT